MIMLFSPLLKRLGYGMTWKDGAVMTWGGLRGAVSLALALFVSQNEGLGAHVGDKVLIFEIYFYQKQNF